ncbi:hypothetical protein [Arthrobacter sp. TMS1-12-1]
MMQRCGAPAAVVREPGRFSLAVLPRMLRLRWEPRIVIGLDDVARVGSLIAASGGPTLPLLVQVAKLKEVTWEARAAILAHEFPTRVAVLGVDAVDRVLTSFLVKGSTEARFFTGRNEAEEWLLQD